MGGFVIDTIDPISIFGDETRFTVTPLGIECIMKYAPHLIPDISAESIRDRSKGDGIAKALLFVQVVYFAISCVLRTAEHLPLSLLEVTTLAHSCCTIGTYFVWWTKPLNVSEPTVIDGADEQVKEVAAALLMGSSAYVELPGGVFRLTCREENWSLYVKNAYDVGPDITVLTPSKDQDQILLDESHAVRIEDKCYFLVHNRDTFIRPWKFRVIFGQSKMPWYAHLQGRGSTVALRRQDILRWTLRERAMQHFGRMAFYSDCDFMFNVVGYLQPDAKLGGASSWDLVFGTFDLPIPLLFTLCTAVYGLPHIIAWNTQVGTHLQQNLWRIASILLSVMPIAALMTLPVIAVLSGRKPDIRYTEPPVYLHSLIPLGFIVYLVSSGYLITMSIRQLSRLPPGAFQQPTLSTFWPHIP